MVNIFALLLTLSILAACSIGSMTNVKNAAADPLPPRESKVEYRLEDSYVSGIYQAEDGTKLATYDYELPVLRCYREDGTEVTEAATPEETHAMEIAETFNKKFDSWRGEDENLMESAQADYAWKQEEGLSWDSPYWQELEYTAYRTGSLISIGATSAAYWGGVHPNSYLMSWNFDLDSGTFLTPDALSADSKAFMEAVRDEIIRQAEERIAPGAELEGAYWDNYPEVVASWDDYAVTFGKDGMSVGFSPYELAYYAAGSQVFLISYDTLDPYLSDYGRQLLEMSVPATESHES